MITERDLLEAIAECQGQRNPDAKTCMKLAAFYIILDHVQDKKQEQAVEPLPLSAYSFSPAPVEPVEKLIDYDGDTEFSRVIYGKEVEKVLSVMDETMTMIQSFMPKMYDVVIKRLKEI